MALTGARTDPRAVHDLLLRLAGRIDDAVLWRARSLLADGRVAESLRTAAAAVAAGGVGVSDADAELLADGSGAPQTTRAALAGVPRADGETVVLHRFAPVGPDVLSAAGHGIPQTIDAPAGQPAHEDDIDRAAAGAVTGRPGVHGLWRAWRYPGAQDGAGAPVRVYLVEADARDVDPHRVTGGLQDALERAGLTVPQVEVTTTDATAPPYQRLARGHAALLWASTPPVEVTTAPVFDRVDPVTGPAFAPDHPRLTDPGERQRVLAYLAGGAVLATTTARMGDILSPARGQVVPMNFRTDGQWIWTDTVAYYLEHHELAPARPLLEHIRARDYRRPEPDGVALFRAAAALRRPARSEPVWTPRGDRPAPSPGR